MKAFIMGIIALSSITAQAGDCDYQVTATDVKSGERVDLCIEAQVDRRGYETVVESVKGSGGAGKRRPIFATEVRSGFFSPKYIISNESETQQALCQLVGEKRYVPGNSLIYYGRDEKMISYSSVKRRWEISSPKSYYLSITTCK